MPAQRRAEARSASDRRRKPTRQPQHKAVERICGIELQSFVRDFLRPRRPVVLAGAAAKWGASSWTLDHLASVVGDISVPLFKSPTPVFHPEMNHSYDRMRVEVRFSDYVRMVKAGGAGDGYYYYLATAPFAEHYPELGKDVDFSYFLSDKKKLHSNIWISMSGTVTPLHFDPFELHNFHAVIRGRKRFVLYEPEAGSFLAPYPLGTRIQHFSQVDLDNPDLRRFPDFMKAQGLECLLEEGDLLFMPMLWWHQVITESPAISVNIWWSEKLLKRPRGSARSGRSRKKGAAGRGLSTA